MSNQLDGYCKLCEASDSTLYLEKDGFQVFKCSTCSVVYLNLASDISGLADFYSDNYFQSGVDNRGYESYQDCEVYLTQSFKRRLKELTRYVPSGRVLDVGCSYGFFLDCLGENYESYGMDISEHAISIAQKKHGLNVKQGVLEKGTFPPKHFSLISMWDVIEHLPEPKRTLEILHANLKDDGVIVLVTGNVDSILAKVSGKKWHLYTLPEHLWFFSAETLSALLEKCGFKVIELKIEWSYYSILYILERLLKTVFNARSVVHNIPFQSLLRKLTVPCSLFDTMYVVAKKQ